MTRLLHKCFVLILSFLILLAFGIAFLPLPGTIPVLMYHFVGTEDQASRHKSYVSREAFERHMAFLKFFRYRILSLDEYYDILTGKKASQGREIVLTFDDGNYSFIEDVYPVVEEKEIPVAVFLISESVRQEVHGSMTIEDLLRLSLSDRITFGSHTKTHPYLSRLREDQIEEELRGSRQDLMELLGVPIDYLAYPNGDVDERVIRLAKQAGYKLAFTTSHEKLKNVPKGLFALPRVKISRTTDNLIAYWAKVSGVYSFFKKTRSKFSRS